MTIVFLILIPWRQAAGSSPEPEITARAFLLMDAHTGKILLQNYPDIRLPPASTTKVLTALVALESGRKPNELLTVSRNAIRVPASKLYLQRGQTISIKHLLYSVLLSSANDASVVLAEGVGGSMEQFVDAMNKKAHAIGALNTHFSNPHGLTAPNHYSSARDLALIFRYAMRNPTFRQIVQTKMSSVRAVVASRKKLKKRLISVRNHNRLLWTFAGAIGGKTGYTHAAQRCFVGAVTRNGMTLIVSLLGSRDLWRDTRRLLEFGFENYETLEIAAQPRPTKTSPSARERAALLLTPPQEPTLAGDGYVLQVGSFREREHAEFVVKQFSATGFNAFLEATSLKEGETAYRLRVGPYPALREAQEAAREIWEGSALQAIVVPMPAQDQE